MVVSTPMMRQHSKVSTIILACIVGLLLMACVPPTPIPVYITPTPDPTANVSSPVPTLEPVPSVTQVTMNGEPSRTPVVIGAVVGSAYTLEPSSTLLPTRTLIPSPTVPPRFTPTQTTAGQQGTPVPAVTNTTSSAVTVAPATIPATVVLPTTAAPATPIPAPPTATSIPLPALDRNRVGVQIDINLSREDWDFALSRATELGVTWVKVQAPWDFLQPNTANADEIRLRTFELNLQTADQRGFNILMSVAKAPPYLRGTTGESGPPDNPQEIVNFLNLLFSQTKIGEVVDAIEVWNEPNLHREWNTTALPFSGAGYMRLFVPAYDAIKAYRSNIIVVTAGLAPTSTIGTFSIDDRDYLRQMYAAGLGQYQDVVIGVHPYGWGNPPDATCCAPGGERGWDEDPHFFFLDNLNDTRAIMNANGHDDVQMWLTEFGWPTWRDLSVGLPDPAENFLFMNYVTPQDQANYTIRALEIAQLERTDIGVAFLWNLNFANDLAVSNRQEVVAYSMMIPGDMRRPLFFLLPQAFNNAP
jgi:polysaccharide biosynthesis protein PslG